MLHFIYGLITGIAAVILFLVSGFIVAMLRDKDFMR